MSNEKRHIFLIGPSGVGKTTVAKEVEKLSDFIMVDLDEAVAQRVSMSVHEYFAKYGEASFREREREVINLFANESTPHVYATGGGTVLDSRNIVDMKNNGHVVYLSAFESDLIERITADNNSHRPLLEGDLEQKVHDQFLVRRQCYELAADITIATSRRDIETVAQAVLRQCMNAGGQNAGLTSAVVVGEDILSKINEYVSGYQNMVLITQASIPEKYSDQIISSLKDSNIEVVKIIVPEGEQAKSFSSFENVINEMAKAKVTRYGCIVALGGGVVGDLSGFVAASYHRGIDVIQVPTTLLAQVDSSLGGKCGINLSVGKNLVGAFHQPKCVIADTQVLSTLTESDFLSGLGEVVKYALLGNTAIVQQIQQNSKKILDRDPTALVPVIQSSMNHKIQIVARDPYERNGIRATLNLGHTLAHVLETQTNYSIAHGQAVAIGLRFAIELSFTMGRISESQMQEYVGLIDLLGLENKMPSGCDDAQKLVDLMYSDKKSDGSLSMVLMCSGAGAELVRDIDPKVVQNALAGFISKH